MLEKPEIMCEKDIDAAYVKLHQQYWYLRNNLESIRKLINNSDNNTSK